MRGGKGRGQIDRVAKSPGGGSGSVRGRPGQSAACAGIAASRDRDLSAGWPENSLQDSGGIPSRTNRFESDLRAGKDDGEAC